MIIFINNNNIFVCVFCGAEKEIKKYEFNK